MSAVHRHAEAQYVFVVPSPSLVNMYRVSLVCLVSRKICYSCSIRDPLEHKIELYSPPILYDVVHGLEANHSATPGASRRAMPRF